MLTWITSPKMVKYCSMNVGIKSITDVITNSSTEVFVVKKRGKQVAENGYFSGINTPQSVNWEPKEITWKWLRSNQGKSEWMMICDLVDKPYTELSTSGDEPDWGRWNDWITLHKHRIQDRAIGLWFLTIRDGFGGFLDMVKDIKDYIVWHENRH